MALNDVSYFKIQGDSTVYAFNDADAEAGLVEAGQGIDANAEALSTLQIKTYRGVQSLGLTTGNATILQVWNALPVGAAFLASAAEFPPLQVPTNVSAVFLMKETATTGTVQAFSQGVTYTKGFSNGSPSGVWSVGQGYAVGDIFMSTVDTSPASRFGGTWEKIENVFLVASGSSYTAGATGGSASNIVDFSNGQADIGFGDGSAGYLSMARKDTTTFFGVVNVAPVAWTGESGQQANPTKLEGTQTLDNRPPYLAVNIWRRVA